MPWTTDMCLACALTYAVVGSSRLLTLFSSAASGPVDEPGYGSAWHTVPPGIAIQKLADKFLPRPKWRHGEKGLVIPPCCQQQLQRVKIPSDWKATTRKLREAKRAIHETEAGRLEKKRKRTHEASREEDSAVKRTARTKQRVHAGQDRHERFVNIR